MKYNSRNMPGFGDLCTYPGRFTDPRSPDYDSSSEDALEATVKERLPEITATAMAEGEYDDCWTEDLDFNSEGHRKLSLVCGDIELGNAVSQEDINRIAQYFITEYSFYVKRCIDNDMDKIRERINEEMQPDGEPDNSCYEQDWG